MAISPKDIYPGQTATGDAGYPLGKANNQAVLGDGAGFPLEKRWVNDLLGFEQALLAEAGLTPTGTPDAVGSSQYLAALQALIAAAAAPLSSRISALERLAGRPGYFEADDQVVTNGAPITLLEHDDPASDYTLHSGSTTIEVQQNGYYWVSAFVNFNSAEEGSVAGIWLMRNSTVAAKFTAKAPPSNAGGGNFQITGRRLVKITDHVADRLSFRASVTAANGLISESYFGIEIASVLP